MSWLDEPVVISASVEVTAPAVGLEGVHAIAVTATVVGSMAAVTVTSAITPAVTVTSAITPVVTVTSAITPVVTGDVGTTDAHVPALTGLCQIYHQQI